MTRYGMRLLGACLAICAVSLMATGPAQGAVQVTLGEAVRAPITVPLALGLPALIQLPARPRGELRVTPSGIVHVIARDTEVLLVPLREGTAELEIGLGTDAIARLELVVSSGWSGLRSLVVTDDISRATPSPTPTAVSPPRSPQQDSPTPASPRVQTPQPSSHPGHPSSQEADPQPPRAGPLGSPPATTEPQAPSAAAGSSQGEDPTVHVAAPAGVRVHVVATRAFGLVYLSYVVQNQTARALRADPRDIDAAGIVGSVTVRQMDIGTPGMIAPGSMETGVIAMTPTGDSATVLWRLRADDGAVVPVEMRVSREPGRGGLVTEDVTGTR